MQTSTPTTEQLRDALQRVTYWASLSIKHIPDDAIAELLIDAIRDAKEILRK